MRLRLKITRAVLSLTFLASRLGTVELNNTFYQRPTVERIAAWCGSVPETFRFVVKAQRGASMRALMTTPEESTAWLTERLEGFGDRLGAVLFRLPKNIHRRPDGTSDLAIRRLLAAWPRTIPLVMEFIHDSWHVDETFAALREAGAILCATELPDTETAPDIRVTGTGLYLRLRRHDYTVDELQAWANRIQPFLDAGYPAFVFFRHDETGRAAELALAMTRLIGGGRADPDQGVRP